MTIEEHKTDPGTRDNSPPAPTAAPEEAVAATERKARLPHPWLSIWISIAALLVAVLSFGTNYFRSNDPPNAIIVTADVKARIDGFYVEGDNFYVRIISLRRDVSPQEFKALDDEVDDWSRRMGDYLQQKLGAAEKGRMLDITGVPPFHAGGGYPAAIDEERARLLFGLAVTKKNLALLIDRLKVR